MEIALFVTLLVIVYLIVLNWHMNGALRIRIYVALFVPWLALLAVMCLAFGWKTAISAIALSFIGAGLLWPLARRTAAFLYARPPRD